MEKLVIERDFWRGRRVFVTGHTGFKGGWLSLWLQAMDAKLSGYALAPATRPSLFELAQVDRDMESEIADVRHLATLQDAIARAAPEVVFHLAAQPLVRVSYREPVETYAINVMGTVHLLEAVRHTPSVRAVVVVTTDKCYENREWLWGYRESDALGGHDPYSNSKAAAELVTDAYRRSFLASRTPAPVALASARAGNVIGGGDWSEDRLVPDIMRAVARGEPVRIRSPRATRPWQHVIEPVAGYLMLAQRLVGEGASFAQAWNFGPEDSDARDVEWIVRHLIESWGPPASWRMDAGEHPHEAGYLKLDISRARAQLGWTPRLGLEDALDWTVAWYKACAKGADMRALTLDQIHRFESLP